MELYKKHRPQKFEEVLGNEHIINFFEKKLKNNSLPSAIMFTGGSGAGKTTLSRIIATQLNVSSNQYFEYNVADDTGVDSARQIVEQATTPSVYGGYKFFVLDEYHQASKANQNCLLKVLEDAPKDCIFVICTTEPNKIINTVKTRCTQFEVDSPSNKSLGGYLMKICTKEEKEVPKDVLKEIVKKSDGSVRKALVNLDKCIHLPVEEMLKSLEESESQEDCAKKLIKALESASNWNMVSKLLKNIKKGEEESFRQYALACFSNKLLSTGEERYSYLIEKFSFNFFESGKAGLINTCFEITKGI